MRLSEVFLASLPRGAFVERGETDATALDALLVRVVDEASASWPTAHVPRERFASHLAFHCAKHAAQSPPETDAAQSPTAALAELRVTDLYLACGCALGDHAALVAFEAAYFGEIQPALVRATRSTELQADVAQALRDSLFSPRPNAPPQIALYAGRGELRNWTRAAIVRVILNLVTRTGRDVPVEADLLSAIPSDRNDPELAHMKETYRAEFRVAFTRAIHLLESRERNLLRHAFVDGLSIEEVGALFGVHRATAARWVARARAKLVAEIRRALMEKLLVDPRELASIMRLIRSQLGVTLARHLADDEGGAP